MSAASNSGTVSSFAVNGPIRHEPFALFEQITTPVCRFDRVADRVG
jgi:hypothetical protein